ncbi:MAG: D-2-hydroxyacid dehydrogenase [Oscillospiraceae bacterium]|nr:D-2-hydroxyacid dehydrogenase [Oscillospiraceae bacterium]
MVPIAVLIPLSDEEKQLFIQNCPQGDFHFFDRPITREEISQYEIICGAGIRNLLQYATKLRFLQLPYAGLDGYADRALYPNPEIVLAGASGAFGPDISEYMLGAVLLMMKNFHLYRDQMSGGLWRELDEPVDSLRGAVVLSVGVGDIGSHFCSLAKALGAHVVGVRRQPAGCPPFCDEIYPVQRLDEVIGRADVTALSVPGTEKTRHLLDAAMIGRMKRGSYLVNVGRGTAVDALALAAALDEGRLAGAALDVTDPEPLSPEHPLWRCKNALITPHVSGRNHYREAHRQVLQICAENIRRVCAGGLPSRPASFEEGY